MTGIAEFIKVEVLADRLQRHEVLVVYDPERRYRDLCLALADETVTVVDASASSIESREAAARALSALGRKEKGVQGLLIYVPAARPLTDEARQDDPFAAYGLFGAVFPDADGDAYESLCIKAKPDYATEIRRLFEQETEPSFALIDSVGGGLKWPTLRTVLQVESAREILAALLAPAPRQSTALQANESWVAEARELLGITLGLKLITRGKTWTSIAEELWRFVLYSEFAFDLPGELPAALVNVPRATPAARPLIETLCEDLRHDPRTRPIYIERAERIEKELGLPDICRDIADLGMRDTFPFEERTILAQAVTALQQDQLDRIRSIIERHRGSVWIGKGESQAQWSLVEAALRLVEVCDDALGELPRHAGGLGTLVDWYVSSLREADRRQREFEQAVGDNVTLDEAMNSVVEHGRRRYGLLIAKVGPLFTRHLEATGWPPPGRYTAAGEVFDRFVQPLLKESGRRVAYILVDALRYELGVALHDQLAESEQAELVPICAQLPTVTPVGMASLLPGAAAGLALAKEGQAMVPILEGARLAQVGQRMDVLRSRFGDRFAEMPLSRFVQMKDKLAETVDLLVLRSNEIDSNLENNPEATLGLIHQTLKQIRVAVHKLKGHKFADVVIATDHGFFLNAHGEAGDLCAKPPGDWLVLHDRSLLGEGAADAGNFVVAAEKVSIRGDFSSFGGPRNMVPYRRGLIYFHGGASLQEAIVPLLTVRLRHTTQPELVKAKVTLSYKGGAKRITTRLPVVEVVTEAVDMFSLDADVEVLLEAHDRKGNIVGEAKPGGAVNVATGTIALKPGDRQQVTVRMLPEYEGKFTLKALNPVTLTAYATLDLETDYAV